MNKPNNKKKEDNYIKVTEFGVSRVYCFDNGNIIFNLMINGVSINGCRVIETKDGDFIGFPSRKGKDGKYYAYAYCKFSEKDTKDILAEVERMLTSN